MARRFGELLRDHRRSVGLTQEGLAQSAELSVQAIGVLERGDRRFPHQDTVTRLADALELTGAQRAEFLAAAGTRKGTPNVPPPVKNIPLKNVPVKTAPVCQLPADVPDFTGRDEQLKRLLAEVEPVECGPPPVVAVVGGPGIGKSTLAVRAAHQVAAKFPDGQLYLDLAGTSEQPREPGVLLAELLRALGVAGGALPDGVPARTTLFRSLLVDRRMLLVLDDATRCDQVRPLLPPNGGCAVIVTSRQRVTDLPGARHIELDVLSDRAALSLFTGIVGAQRVAAEPDEAAAIVTACDRLPLAIRIAAGRLVGRPAWPLRLLRNRLADESRRLNELRLGGLGVRASFEASVSQLPEEATRALWLLALVGPRTVPGWVLAPLLDQPDAEDVLDLLLDANLVRLTGIDASGCPRYRLHDLLRVYAGEGAESIPEPQRRAAMQRLLAVWLWLAVRAANRLPPSLFEPPQGKAPRLPISTVDLDAPDTWFEAEREALIGAVELAVAWQLDDAAWELAAAVVPYHDLHSNYEDWRRTHILALGAVRAAENVRGEAVMLRGLAQINVYRDEYDAASEGFRRALELSRQTGDRYEEFFAICGLGVIDRVHQRYDKSEAHVREALEIAIGDPRLEAHSRNSLGMVLHAQGRDDEATASFECALDICRRTGDRHREAVVLREMSVLHGQQGALDHLTRAMEIFEEMDDERCVAYTLLRMGKVHAAHRDLGRATLVLQRAAQFFANNGNRMEEAQCWQLRGELAADRGLPTARQALTQALRLWQSIGAVKPATEVQDRLNRLD